MSKQYLIQLERVVKFYDTVKVVVEDGVDFEEITGKLEREGDHPDDMYYYLNGDKGVKILSNETDEEGIYSYEVSEIKEVK